MCRSIKPLFNFDPPATENDIHAAARQFVRKIAGFHKPSKANEPAFEQAIEEITAASSRLLAQLATKAPPKTRQTPTPQPHPRA